MLALVVLPVRCLLACWFVGSLCVWLCVCCLMCVVGRSLFVLCCLCVVCYVLFVVACRSFVSLCVVCCRRFGVLVACDMLFSSSCIAS